MQGARLDAGVIGVVAASGEKCGVLEAGQRFTV
jgi:hypothetical protein